MFFLCGYSRFFVYVFLPIVCKAIAHDASFFVPRCLNRQSCVAQHHDKFPDKCIEARWNVRSFQNKHFSFYNVWEKEQETMAGACEIVEATCRGWYRRVAADSVPLGSRMAICIRNLNTFARWNRVQRFIGHSGRNYSLLVVGFSRFLFYKEKKKKRTNDKKDHRRSIFLRESLIINPGRCNARKNLVKLFTVFPLATPATPEYKWERYLDEIKKVTSAIVISFSSREVSRIVPNYYLIHI